MGGPCKGHWSFPEIGEPTTHNPYSRDHFKGTNGSLNPHKLRSPYRGSYEGCFVP